MQLLAGNIVVHAVAYNASHRCASRRHDDDRTAAVTVAVTAAGRAAARGIAAGGAAGGRAATSRTAARGRRHRGNGAAARRTAARVIAAGGRRYRGHDTGIGVIGLGNIQGKRFVDFSNAAVLVGHLSAAFLHRQGAVSVLGGTLQVSDPAYIKVSGQDAGV